MVSNSVVDGGFDPWVKSKTTKLITFPLIMQHKRVRAKTSRIRVMIMCLSGVKCLPMDCCFIDLPL
jgi:hypothetical protein